MSYEVANQQYKQKKSSRGNGSNNSLARPISITPKVEKKTPPNQPTTLILMSSRASLTLLTLLELALRGLLQAFK